MAALVDTNVLVYLFDPSHPVKQQRAADLIRLRSADGSLQVAHQALLEFVAVVTRPKPSRPPLLSDAEARTEVENLLVAFPVLFPTEDVVRAAIRGAAVYHLPWFDAHMWAFAEVFGLDELLSEDFQDGRQYGRVRARNPFA